MVVLVGPAVVVVVVEFGEMVVVGLAGVQNWVATLHWLGQAVFPGI
jgi:hypothetical protein